MIKCKMCDYNTYDKKRSFEKCSCACLMTQEEYDAYFCERKDGCPFFCPKSRIDLYIPQLQAVVV